MTAAAGTTEAAGPRCPSTGRPLLCPCGAPAPFGFRVRLLEGRVGTWRCADCARREGLTR